jgi:site-specific recombinase XerD
MPGRGRFKDVDMWPERDRGLWRRGISPASLLDDTGHAAKWPAATVSMVERGYASFLHWLEASGLLMSEETPEQRTVPERIEAYRAYLDGKVKPTTIRLRLYDLKRALGVLAPRMDVSFLKRRIRAYPKQGDRLRKRGRMQDLAALLQLGLDLMSEAASKPHPTRRDAVIYRDGLLIAILAYRLMRLRNLTSIEMERHLQQAEMLWSLQFAPNETKNHRAWLNSWPEELVPHLRQYLRVYRPILMDGRYDGNHLWVSQRSGPLTDNGIYYAITTRTKAAFGQSVNPHLFRDCAATSLAIHDPANVQLARHALGHCRYRTTQDYYNQAQCIEASDNLNTAMDRLRRQRRHLGRRGRVRRRR